MSAAWLAPLAASLVVTAVLVALVARLQAAVRLLSDELDAVASLAAAAAAIGQVARNRPTDGRR